MSSRPPERKSGIARAFAPGVLAMHYQPIIDLHSGMAVGFEALARFALEPHRPPNVWFEEAEHAGRGIELQLLAIEAVVASFGRLPLSRVGVYCAETDACYLLTVAEVGGLSQLHLRLAPAKNNQRVGVRMAEQYEFTGAVAQLGERLAGSQKVRGSSPLSSTDPKAA